MEPGFSIHPEMRPARAGWDCHVHVFGPGCRYALAEPRAYSPAPAGVAKLRQHLAASGAERVVLVQPSPYGDDDSCLLDALAEMGPDHRAVVAAEGRVGWLPDAQARGVRGWRFNPLGRLGLPDPGAIGRVADLARNAAARGMSLELGLSPAAMAAWAPHLAQLPGQLVLSHFGGALHPAHGPAAIEALAALLGTGRLWLKLSGADRWPSALASDRLEEVVLRLASLAPERLLWGSDWPNTPLHDGRPEAGEALRPHRMVDAPALLARIAAALGSRAAPMLQANPAALYG